MLVFFYSYLLEIPVVLYRIMVRLNLETKTYSSEIIILYVSKHGWLWNLNPGLKSHLHQWVVLLLWTSYLIVISHGLLKRTVKEDFKGGGCEVKLDIWCELFSLHRCVVTVRSFCSFPFWVASRWNQPWIIWFRAGHKLAQPLINIICLSYMF